MSVTLSSLAGAGAQFFDNNGVPLAGGLIYTYLAGTTTPEATYTSSTGLIAHANPIVLDAAGRIATGEVWLTSGIDYKFLVKTSAGVQLGSYDNIPSINDFTSIYAALANTTNVALGDALVGFKQSNSSGVLPNAVGRTVHQKLQETISIQDFGAVGDGATDDTAAIQAAIDSLGAKGGTVLIPNAMQCYVAGNLTVNPNCGIKGPHIITGSPQNNANIPYADVGGVIRLASTATITMKGGSALQGLLIYRYGMTFPAADDSQFAGIAVMIEFDDVAIFQCEFLGFEFAIKSTVNAQRARIYDCNMDNKNGIYIDTCPDILRVENVQCWPFAGSASPGNIRSGTAFKVVNNADWAKFTNCFSWGYNRGFQIFDCNNVTLLSCGADGPVTQSGSFGFEVSADSDKTNIIACQAGGREVGYYINADVNKVVYIANSTSFSCVFHGVLIDGGTVTISGGGHQGNLGCITVNDVASIVSVDNVTFDYANTIGTPIAVYVSNPNVYVSPNNLYLNYVPAAVATTIPLARTIATSGSIELPITGIYFKITGAGTISTINGGYIGRTLIFEFATANTVVDNSGNLQLAGNLTANTNTTLQLIYNGANWLELSRSVNG